MKLSRRDKVVTTVVVAIILLLLYFLQCHFRNKSGGQSSAKPVGTVEYKYHEVQRKFADSLQWQDVDVKSPVYAYDWVMTKQKSDARITLKNGLKVDMDPESMIEIDENQAGVGLTLHSGSVQADAKDAKDAKIKTADGTEIELSNAKTQIATDGSSIGIDVKEGNVSVKKDGKAEHLEAGEVGTLTKGTLKKEKTQIQLLTPVDGVVIDDTSKEVEFSFKKPAGAKDCKIFLESERKTRTIAAKTSPTRTKVDAGSYKWRTQCTKDAAKITSGTGIFRARADNTFELTYPSAGQTVYANEANNLSLRWKSDTPVKVELSEDAAFKKIIRKETTADQSLAVGSLKQGKYYWRLSPTSAKRAPKTASFTVSDKGELLAEVDSREQKGINTTKSKTGKKLPAEGESIEPKGEETHLTGKKHRLTASAKESFTLDPDQAVALALISWKPVGKNNYYRVRVSPTKSFSKVVKSANVKGKGSAVLSLKPGTYYYRVDVRSKSKGAPLASTLPQKIVVVQKKLPLPPEVKSVEAD